MNLSVLFRENLLRVGGEWLAREIENIVRQVSGSWAKEHQPDDTHGDVHALSVSERGRAVPMGEWISVEYRSTDFTASGAMTWTVQAADVATFKYMLLGKTMFVVGSFTATSVGGVPDVTLRVKIPNGMLPAMMMASGNRCTDNAVGVMVSNTVRVDQDYIEVFRFDAAVWTASVNNSNIRVAVAFEVR